MERYRVTSFTGSWESGSVNTIRALSASCLLKVDLFHKLGSETANDLDRLRGIIQGAVQAR